MEQILIPTAGKGLTRLAVVARLTLIVTMAAAVCASPRALAQDNATPIGTAVSELPLFDAHVHYKQEAWTPYPLQTVLELFDRNGVAMALVSSTPDEGTIRLFEFAPNRIVPEVRPYHDGVTSSNWTSADGIADYLQGRLEAHPHQGIGEFHLHGEAMWHEPLMRRVIAMARERSIPLHVHSGSQPIRRIYAVDPGVTVIWAHAGLGESPAAIHELMGEFPTLHADTSLREREILGEGNLDPVWRRIIIDFQDRLMVGSDTWINAQWDRYDDIVESNRRWLALLPRDIAEKIAYRNAARLFGRDVSMRQIGTR